MRRCLQFALMAIPITATFLSLTPQIDSSDSPITVSTDDSGNNACVSDNDFVLLAPKQTFHSERSRLVSWSTTEHRSNAVRRADVEFAGAAEVGCGREKPTAKQNSSPASGFTQREIDTAVDTAARGDIVTPKPVRALAKMESNLNLMAGRKGAVGLMLWRPDPGN